MNVKVNFIENNVREFHELLHVFEEAFEWKDFILPNEKYLEGILKNENFIAITAKAENQIVGGLTAYILYGYETPKPFIYIYDIAVRNLFQNQGIGKKLIEFLRTYAFANGFHEIYVDTEHKDNEQVLNFYRKTNISSEVKVAQFSYLPSD